MKKNNVLIVGASSFIGIELIKQIANNSTVVLSHFHSHKNRFKLLEPEIQSNIVPICGDLSTEKGINEFIESIAAICDFPEKIVFLAAPQLTRARFKDLEWKNFSSQIDMQLCTAWS